MFHFLLFILSEAVPVHQKHSFVFQQPSLRYPIAG